MIIQHISSNLVSHILEHHNNAEYVESYTDAFEFVKQCTKLLLVPFADTYSTQYSCTVQNDYVKTQLSQRAVKSTTVMFNKITSSRYFSYMKLTRNYTDQRTEIKTRTKYQSQNGIKNRRYSTVCLRWKSKGKGTHIHSQAQRARDDPLLQAVSLQMTACSHEPGAGLPPPPTRPTATHMQSHKRGGRLPLLSARPTVTYPAVGITALRPVPTYTAW